MSIHQGHRQRLRQRFRKEGLESFNEINILELLLFYCIPQKDTNPIAHALLDRFGSLRGVLDAKTESIACVKGVGESTAAYLSMLSQLARYYACHSEDRNVVASDSVAYLQIFRKNFLGAKVEKICMLCLDSTHRVLACIDIATGDVGSAELPVRTVVEHALYTKAAYVVLAHNHPCGVAVPSDEDIDATIRMGEALSIVGVMLEDHLILAETDSVSLRNSRYYHPEMLRK